MDWLACLRFEGEGANPCFSQELGPAGCQELFDLGDDALQQEEALPNFDDDENYSVDYMGDDAGTCDTDGADGAVEEAVTYREALAAAAAERARLDQAEQASDTDPDTDAEPAGAGLRGRGEPMSLGHGTRRRNLCDGAGLCSPGLWAPRERPRLGHPRILAIRAAIQRYVAAKDADDCWSEHLFERLARGEVAESPLPEPEMSALAEYAMGLYDGDEAGGARPRAEDQHQVVRIRLLQSILRDANDPDWRGMDRFAAGIRLGVGRRMPRTPAVYARKRRWRIAEQAEADDWDPRTVIGVWRENYKTARAQRAEVRRQLDEHVEQGLAFRLSAGEAKARYPALQVASLGAVVKEDDAGQVTSVRLVLDGTNGIDLNRRIRQRDQDRCPTVADARRVQREQARYGRVRGLAVDFKGAHRLPMVHPEDWRHQACRAEEGDDADIYFYKCGVFGISSIAYYWSRLGGAAVRAAHYVADPAAEMWLLLMADDLKVESTSPRPHRPIVSLLVFFTLLRLPISWGKIQGGSVIQWIGYELHLDRYSLGVTARRAAHSVTWLRRIIRDRRIKVAEFRSELGRLSFICGALEYERPFLSPLYAFLGVCRHQAVRSLPRFVAVACEYLASRLELRRLYPSAERRRRSSTAPRVDARAEGQEIGIGGWEPVCDSAGRPDLSSSRWFMLNLTATSAPWAYSRNGEPYRSIASLEAFATLMAVIAFQGETDGYLDHVISLPTLTDNQGNESALRKLASSSFPLSIVIMELAAQLESRAARLDLNWIPRESNCEADRLSNGDSRGFSPANRVLLDVSKIEWKVLNKLSVFGLEYQEATRSKAGVGTRS